MNREIDPNDIVFPNLPIGEVLERYYDGQGDLMVHETESVRDAVREYVARFFINTSSLDFIADAADAWDGDWAALPLSANQIKAIEASLTPDRPVFEGNE